MRGEERCRRGDWREETVRWGSRSEGAGPDGPAAQERIYDLPFYFSLYKNSKINPNNFEIKKFSYII